MNKQKIAMVSTLALLLCLSLVSATVYDDFSGSILDATKWTEITDTTAAGNLDEFGVSSTHTGYYHTAQLTPADRGILLMLDREFNAGEVLQYKTIYQSGSGNVISRPYLDGQYLDLRIGTNYQNYPEYATTANIGYWNGDSEVGNIIGTYSTKVSFGENYVDFEIINPAQASWNYRINNLQAPYTYGVATRTGHNGIVHFDYDEFKVLTDEPSTPSELELRVISLETAVSELQNLNLYLQEQNDALQTQLDAHLADTSVEDRVTSLETTVNEQQEEINNLWTAIETKTQELSDFLQSQIEDLKNRVAKLEEYSKLWEKYGWFKKK